MKTYRVFLSNGSHVDVNAEYFDISSKDDHLELIKFNEEGLEDFIAVFKRETWQYIVEIVDDS